MTSQPAPPSARASRDELMGQAMGCVDNPVIKIVLEAVGGFVLVLNEARQVLAASTTLLHDLGIEVSDLLISMRPGEVLECEHAHEGPDGCNTSKSCEFCGAYIALIAAQRDQVATTGECRIMGRRNGLPEARDFRIRVTPLDVGGRQLLIFVLQDISGEKRRACLERTFFHDIKNTLQGLQGWSDLLLSQRDSPERVASHIVELAERLTHEVESHQLLALAEQGELQVSLQRLQVCALFDRLERYFEGHPTARDRRLHIQTPGDARFRSDLPLLERILVNMVKNALEAIGVGEEARVWFSVTEGHPTFHVHNPGFIPDEVAAVIFQRSFSTKSTRGRGLGTYSMRLFGETYLGGKVTLLRADGIEFQFQLPLGAMDS